MTRLRKMMLEELERRNYAETTKECYIQAVEEFARYFNRPPDRLGPAHIRQFQAHLFTDRKLAPNTVNQRLAALRFFFVKTLRRYWNADETPCYAARLSRDMAVGLSMAFIDRVGSSVLPLRSEPTTPL